MSSLEAISNGFRTLNIDPSQRLRGLRMQMEAAEVHRRVELNKMLSRDSRQGQPPNSSNR